MKSSWIRNDMKLCLFGRGLKKAPALDRCAGATRHGPVLPADGAHDYEVGFRMPKISAKPPSSSRLQERGGGGTGEGERKRISSRSRRMLQREYCIFFSKNNLRYSQNRHSNVCRPRVIRLRGALLGRGEIHLESSDLSVSF